MIHIYTGNGKGKTTAALGLALRASGCGMKVFIGQFLKGKNYGELVCLRKNKNIKVEQFGTKCFVKTKPAAKDIALAKKGLKKIEGIIASKKFSVVILDEIIIAIYLKLIDVDDVLKIIKTAPKSIELILTGRYASNKLIRTSDYVTEMKEIRHPFKNKVKARKGIEF